MPTCSSRPPKFPVIHYRHRFSYLLIFAFLRAGAHKRGCSTCSLQRRKRDMREVFQQRNVGYLSEAWQILTFSCRSGQRPTGWCAAGP
jgi:hypothetical protein